MRRKDREITNQDEMIDIIKRCETVTLGLNDDIYPYLVPLNFGLSIEDGIIYLYFHSANSGTKLDLIHRNPYASFSMSCNHEFILYEERMSCTMGYESIIGQGIIEILDEQDKLKGLKIIMNQYHEIDFPFNEKVVPATTVYRLKVEHMTGKRRMNNHLEEKQRKPRFMIHE